MKWLTAYIACLCFFFPPGKERMPARTPAIDLSTLRGNDSVSCVLPFSRVGNLVLIKAKADTTEGNFVLDTGAPYLVLNITYFRDYPATSSEAQQTSVGGTSAATVSRTTVGHLSLGKIDYYHMDADLANLAPIENSKGVKILGLLGMELFKQCEMIVDNEKGLIYLHRIGKKESGTYRHELLKDATAYHTLPIDITDNHMVVQTEMSGRKLRLAVDCAAESNILDSRLPDRIFDSVTITRRVKVLGSGNKPVDALYGDLRNLRIGDSEIGSMPVLIINLENTCFSSLGCIDGVLGFDFLSMHQFGFNFVKRKMYIWK